MNFFNRRKREAIAKDINDPNYLSLQIQLQNLYAHDMLIKFFAEQGLDAPWSLEQVLNELTKLGSCSISPNSKHVYGCSLLWGIKSMEEVSGTGETILLASLRCLLEASYLISKQASTLDPNN